MNKPQTQETENNDMVSAVYKGKISAPEDLGEKILTLLKIPTQKYRTWLEDFNEHATSRGIPEEDSNKIRDRHELSDDQFEVALFVPMMLLDIVDHTGDTVIEVIGQLADEEVVPKHGILDLSEKISLFAASRRVKMVEATQEGVRRRAIQNAFPSLTGITTHPTAVSGRIPGELAREPIVPVTLVKVTTDNNGIGGQISFALTARGLDQVIEVLQDAKQQLTAFRTDLFGEED